MENSIQRTDLFNIRFYEKTRFHGSFCGMHYRIEKIADGEETKLRATVWPGSYNFDHTADDLKTSALFDFSNEGLDAVTDYLNGHFREHAEEFKGTLLH
ncbi:MAG: GNAT family acetyltransferase [Clostridiales bacterium]|nr:GNAT family acetyltransferase [Clostridiales bacterium]